MKTLTKVMIGAGIIGAGCAGYIIWQKKYADIIYKRKLAEVAIEAATDLGWDGSSRDQGSGLLKNASNMAYYAQLYLSNGNENTFDTFFSHRDAFLTKKSRLGLE